MLLQVPVSHSFLALNDSPQYRFIHSSVYGHLSGCPFLANGNSATMNYYVFLFLRYIPGSGIAGAYGNYVYPLQEFPNCFSKQQAPFYVLSSRVVTHIFLTGAYIAVKR